MTRTLQLQLAPTRRARRTMPEVYVDGQRRPADWGPVLLEVPADRPAEVAVRLADPKAPLTRVVLQPDQLPVLEYTASARVSRPGVIGGPGHIARHERTLQLLAVGVLLVTLATTLLMTLLVVLLTT